MGRVISIVLFTWGAAPVLWAHDEPSPGPKTPRERYQSLVREYQQAEGVFWGQYLKIKSREDQGRFIAEHHTGPGPYIPRFLEVAESAPQDQVAIDSFIWIVRNGGCNPEVNRAVEQLASNYAGNGRLGVIVPRLMPNLVYSLSPSAEKLLRAIIAKNPDRVIQGQTRMLLAEYLKRESELVRALMGDTPQARQMRSYYQMQGADEASYRTVRGWNPDDLAKQSQAMLGSTAKEYADVSDFLRLVDMDAQAKLFANPELGIGKPAPGIAGEDIDGNLLKLGDYKGRVVVLFFWGDWCQACRTMYPLARSLVKKMKGRPFALLGVNSDGDKGKLRQRIKDDNIDWRSWWDGGGAHGPIAGKFSIPGWPTTYILDHHGVIRFKFLGLPPDDEDLGIDKVLDELTTEAVNESRSSPPIRK